jgi:hypothetical protein
VASRPTGMVRWSGLCLRWSGWRCVRSARVSCRRRSGSRSRICVRRAGASGRSRSRWVGHARPSRVSCAATQRRRGLSSVRGPPSCDRASGSQSSTDRSHRRVETGGCRAFGPAVESAADQRSFAGEVRRAAQDVAMSREHLSGYLAAGIGVVAAIAAGAASSLTVAHWATSPSRSSAHRTASVEV